MSKKGFYFALIISISFFCCMHSVPSRAEDACLTDITVTDANKERLTVSFNVKDCFTDDMSEAIMNGIPVKFTFIVKLYELIDGQFDPKIADIRLMHKIEYNALKKEFTLFLPEQTDKEVKTKDFNEAKKLMTKVVGLKVIGLDELKQGSRYKLRTKAELDKIELPFYLDYVFFFLSLWDFETDWYAIVFRY